MDYLAFDSSPSVRSIDTNGFLHIKISPFTKEQVAPYYGREIPNWEKLKLDPDKIYYGYRPAEELKKPETVNSLNGIPVQFRHHPDFADAPAKETRVGAAGTNAEWRSPYLLNSMTIYDNKAKNVIDNGYMRELSLAYQYDPDFKKQGSFNGQKYDFVMRNIRANHVALVEEGRAGKDVLVYDSKQEEDIQMEYEKISELETLLLKTLTALHASHANHAPKSEEVKAEVEEEDKVDAVDGILGKLGDKISDDEKAELKKSILALGSKIQDDACVGNTAKDEDLEKKTAEGVKETKDLNLDNDDEGEGEGEEEKGKVLVEGYESDDEDNDDEYEEEEETEELGQDDEDLDLNTAQKKVPTENNSDIDGKLEKLIQDAIKACGLENEDEEVKKAFAEGIRYGERSGKGMAQDSAVVNDICAIYDMIQAEAKQRFNGIASAAEDVKSVLGKIKVDAYDAAEEVYMDACKQLGIKCTMATARDAYNAFNAGHKKVMAQDNKLTQPKTVISSLLNNVRIEK